MNDPRLVYLDHAASSPVRPAALEAMLPWLRGVGANPSGAHRAARAARRAMDDARDQVAALVGSAPGEVVFTSGGTEADNLAVLGAVDAALDAGPTGVARCTAVEHPAVLEAVRRAGGRAGSVALPVDRCGVVDLAAAEAILAADAAAARRVAVVSVMAANNEVGVCQPVAEVSALARRLVPGALVHTDAVQAAAWLDLGAIWSHVDLLSLSGHKFGAPKGVGALVVRHGSPLRPRQIGGGQESGRRAGTPSVASIVAMGAAAAEVAAERDDAVVRVAALRDRLVAEVTARCPSVRPTVPPGLAVPVLPNIGHLCVRGVDSEALLYLLDEAGVAAAAASSCASGAHQRSHVLDAMGVEDDLARGALRLSLGVGTTAADIDVAVDAIGDAVARLVAS